MSHEELGIIHKKLDGMLIASIRFPMQQREELKPKFEKLSQQCKDFICGPAFIIYHWGTGVEPFDIEAGVPVTQTVEIDDIHSRILEGANALATLHFGSYETIQESFQKLYGYIREHGISIAPSAREVFLEVNPGNLEENVTEV